MTKLRLITISFGSVLVAGSALLVACSDDTTINSTDSGTPETSTVDVYVPPEGDATPDAGDASDAEVDGGYNATNLPSMIAAAYCQSVARCCYGDATLEAGAPIDGGGTFDQAACLSQSAGRQFESSNVGVAAAADAGTIGVDQAKAADCLAKVAALTCNLDATEYLAARTACFGAYKGAVTDGAACSSSVECSPNSFCKAPDFGTPGTCAPLRASGGTCGDFTTGGQDTAPALADEACSFRASGVPALHCDSSNDDFTLKTPQTDWTCVANVANGEFCLDSNWCASGLCDINDYTCKSPLMLFAEAACGAYKTTP